MLKEMVELIQALTVASQLLKSGEGSDHNDDEAFQKTLADAVIAIGQHDNEKRKTDEAICLLFRVISASRWHLADGGYGDGVKYSDGLVARAERLLGFASLETAST